MVLNCMKLMRFSRKGRRTSKSGGLSNLHLFSCPAAPACRHAPAIFREELNLQIAELRHKQNQPVVPLFLRQAERKKRTDGPDRLRRHEQRRSRTRLPGRDTRGASASRRSISSRVAEASTGAAAPTILVLPTRAAHGKRGDSLRRRTFARHCLVKQRCRNFWQLPMFCLAPRISPCSIACLPA